jgi:2-methylaconitate cis-trans-isomerase PrpF
MAQREIPFLFIRGGTSRGPYFNAADLPSDRDAIAKILLQAVGAGHPLNIDGIGGGNAVTNKVAMLSRSADDAADIDYFFAQVSVLEQLVDFKPTCGNILSGVGPAAIEMGLMPASDPVTEVRIKLVNTGALVVARVQTPGGVVRYDGDTAIDGVPGTAARIDLQFMDVVGAATGKLLPTGNLRDQFDDIEVTCMDVAMPTVTARADAFGLSGHETVQELKADKNFMAADGTRQIGSGCSNGHGRCDPIGHAKICHFCTGKGRGHDCRTLFYAMGTTSDNGGNWRAMPCFMRHDTRQYRRWFVDAANNQSGNRDDRTSVRHD